jgi:hypothetical protein
VGIVVGIVDFEHELKVRVRIAKMVEILIFAERILE